MNRPRIRVLVTFAGATLLTACASFQLHRNGLEDFDQGRYEIGLQKLEQAATADPRNFNYKLDLKGRHEEAVQKLIAEGDKARASGDAAAAVTSYKRVLAIESGNSRAARGIDGVAADQRHAQSVVEVQKAMERGDYDRADGLLRVVLAEDPGFAPANTLRAKLDMARGPITVTPRLRTRDNRPVTLQFRDASTKMVFEVLSRQTGINFIFDKDVRSDGKTTIFVQDVPIEQAIDLVLGQNQLSRQLLSENMVLIYPNTAAKQKDYLDQIVKTFYLNTALPKDVENLLKTVLGAKTLVVNERAGALTIRDTPENVRMAEKLVASVDLSEPEVMMEVEVLEISRSKLQQLGIAYPSSVRLATPEKLVASDLHRQDGSTISVSQLGVTVDALKSVSVGNVLASPRIRARNKEKAKILIGSRVPVISTAATASGNGGVVSNTSVQYLDVGLTLDVEPTIYSDNDVAIKVNLEVSNITKQFDLDTGSGGKTRAYEIGTRNASTLLQLKDGETQVLAGLIRDTDTRSSSRVPGLGDIPIIGHLFADHSNTRDKTEVVLSITPRIIRAKPRPSGDTTEFWFGTESRSGLAPLGSATTLQPAPAQSAGGPAATPTDVSTAGAGIVVGSPAGATEAGAPPAADKSTAPQSTGSRFSRFRGATGVPAARAPDAAGAPPPLSASITGPAELKVGDEFKVTMNLQSSQGMARMRAQLRFDVSTFQYVSGEPGSLVSSAAGAKVTSFAGGVQLEATAPAGEAFSGSGELMILTFKALQAKPQAAFAGLVTAMNEAGTETGSSSPEPLSIAISGE